MNKTIYNNLLVDISDGIMTITVNRPDKLNALNRETIREIGAAIEQGAGDSSILGIILTGSGQKAFVAGADIAEFTGISVEEGKKLSAAGHQVFKSIETCPKPVLAAVNGFALGGGCELAMSCHLRLAADHAKFGQPEVKLGLIPGYAGTQRLVQLIGKGKAMEYLMTADMMDAAEANRLGLVNYVTKGEELIPKCREMIRKISLQSPRAIAGIIHCVDAYFKEGVDGFAEETEEFGKCFGTDDFREGVAAFLEKRKPVFSR
ncbi:MAG: enoyl-CoA hydratase/isomerase family protein [Bacteroidia bacterium]|nr:enoyl-CoA hydratase/isomerase family protein [Bacteroidia bacterium]